jgi:hypothetical protein
VELYQTGHGSLFDSRYLDTIILSYLAKYISEVDGHRTHKTDRIVLVIILEDTTREETLEIADDHVDNVSIIDVIS